MHPDAPMTSESFRRAGHELIDWIARYLDTVQERPITPEGGPGTLFDALPTRAPEHPEPWSEVARDIDRLILPAVTHWQSPGFFGYFPCNASPPAVLGELLSAGLGINGFLWQCSPAVTELEMRVMDWLAEALALPEAFRFGPTHERAVAARGGGVIQGTASEAVLTAIVAARARAQASAGADATGPLVAYASSQAHSSVVKAAMVAGIGRENIRAVETDGALAMRPGALADAIARDARSGARPFFVCATVGATSTGAADPVRAVADAARRAAPGVWLHIDAAWAGAACICPEHRPLIDGVEEADSLSFNPHKWLLTNFDCSAFWTRDRRSLTGALSITPEYLRNRASDAGAVIDYRDWQIPLGRRFRALKLWFVMRCYGTEGLRAHIRRHVALAELFERLVREDDRFQIPLPRSLSLVCFRLRAGDEATRALMESANRTGRVLLTHTAVPLPAPDGGPGADAYLIRFAVGAAGVEERHIREAWALIRSLAPAR